MRIGRKKHNVYYVIGTQNRIRIGNPDYTDIIGIKLYYLSETVECKTLKQYNIVSRRILLFYLC